MTGFYVNQLFRLATAKIFCPLPGCMLVKSPGDIDSNAGVKRVVGTEDDIDEPVHESIIPRKTKKMTIFRIFQDADAKTGLC